MRKKFQARCRFRALFRKVVANLYWLTEDEEVYEGDNVQKRIEQAMRAKSNKKSLLSLTDKVLLNKPVAERTDAEKRYIYRKIGGLKCFKRYPNYVKRKLAAATYFRYYGPNRVIVRQNQEAHALYFVVTGEVIVSILIFDELLKKHISINVFVMHPGDMFGEVSLLHNIKRTATCTTSGHCEFLALMTADFKDVLQKSLQKQWDEVKQAMDSFSYFDGLDEVARREGCIVAKMKSYEPDDTILGDGTGMTNCVYFVLSGNCQMIESLKISSKEIHGRKYYSLYDPFVQVEKPEESEIHKKYFGETKQADKSNTVKINKEVAAKDENSNSKDVDQEKDNKMRTSVSKVDVREIRKTVERSKRESKGTITSKNRVSHGAPLKKEESDDAIELSKFLMEDNKEFSQREFSKSNISCEEKNIQTYFMQVCIFNPGSTFGFGEIMRDRRIVAMTRVDCMILPLVWLWQKNTANIWSRVQHYLEKKIPTKKQLFEHFLQQRRWLEWRDSLVEEIISRTKTVNFTTIHDVPYSIRIQEMPDI